MSSSDPTPGQQAAVEASTSSRAARDMDHHAEKAKEREFYRYWKHDKSPSQSASSMPPGALETASRPAPSDDRALTAFAQLGALRLNARRCLISFFDRRNCYILAEATPSLSLRTGRAPVDTDNLCWGICVFPKHMSICYYTVNLPIEHHGEPLDDYDSVPHLVVNDLSLDERFKNYASVTRFGNRFYAGVPIISPSGHPIGTYCVLDDKPRDGISDIDLAFLKDMAATVMRHLEMTRAADDHRRRGVMVRSLGSFAEGKSNLEDWWQDLWENEAAASGLQFEGLHLPRRRGRTTSGGAEAPKTEFTDPFIVNNADSFLSSSPSVKSPSLATPESILQGSTAVTPGSDILSEPRHPETVPVQTASSARDGPHEGRLSPEVKALFARAAKMIREATEADGVIFFDAKISTFGGLVDDEFVQEQDVIEQDKPCVVLGGSTKSRPDSSGIQNPLYEAVLRHLLRTYAHGQIFNFDDDSQWNSLEHVDIQDLPKVLTETLGIVASISSKRPDSSKSQDDENLLKDVFPKARSLVLYPLWDSHRDQWFASAIIWSSDPKRVFSVEQELNYLAAFSNSIMAEVARLDTKLADAAKGDFISSISHELRSPLHGILGCCELLRDTKMNNFQSNMAQTIETCGKTLLDTINHVLDFAKINSLTKGAPKSQKKRTQSTKHIISPAQSHTNDIMTLISDVDLSVLTEEVLETVFAGYNFQKSATSHIFETPSTRSDTPPISVIVDISKNDNYVFRTQPGAWRRVLMNLFGNALKYTPAGYTKVKLQVIPGTSPNDDLSELRLIVIDSGIGMSEDYVNNRLFHSFAQENPLSQGTGLGLSIVKQIVESLGGDIEVRSQKDHGTKFTVCCPLKISVLSPDSAGIGDKELLAVRKRTTGMKVSFIGFDVEGGYFPVRSLKNKNATMLTRKALDGLCTDWFGMKVQKPDTIDKPTDLFIATEAGAKWLRAQQMKDPESSSMTPCIVVCQGPAAAQSTTAITVPGRIFECISQPCGPHKLAKALTSCFDRAANRPAVSSLDADPTLRGLERLNLKENQTPPLSPTFKSVVRNPLLDDARPPLPSAFSAPEIGSITSSPTKQIPPKTQRPLYCLAADDNPINLRLLSTFIEKLRHKHGLATNGLEAVAAFKEAIARGASFDVVLMDINMPEMDGLEATRQIRAYERDEGLKPVTIIALTGVASSEAQQEAHVSGVNLFLIKPVRLCELETVLNGVVITDDIRLEGKKSGNGEGSASVAEKTGSKSIKSEEKGPGHKRGWSMNA